KIPAEKKAKIEASLERLKESHKNKDLAEIESAMQQLNEAWNDASQDLYQAQQEAAAGGDGAEAEGSEEAAPDADVKDVDFEVVDEDEAK
ncbi:MAG: molecular chaperone DnaK, partial [Thalassolituus oleivorans]